MLTLHILDGSVTALLGIGCFVLAKKLSGPDSTLGNLKVCEGAVTAVNGTGLTVSYTLDGRAYSAAVNDELRAKLKEMPPAGTQVSVSVLPEQPEAPVHIGYMREMGRGMGSSRAFLPNSRKEHRKLLILAGTMLLAYGMYQLLHGFGLI